MRLGEILMLEARFSPIVYFGDKDRPSVEYARSRGDLNKIAKEKMGKFGIDLEDIINLFAQHNVVVVDSMEFEFQTKELKMFREYDRKLINNFTGKLSGEEFMELENDIRKHGIKDPVMLVLDRQPDGNVLVSLGEGNHRLALAQKLGIKKLPVRLSYRK